MNLDNVALSMIRFLLKKYFLVKLSVFRKIVKQLEVSSTHYIHEKNIIHSTIQNV